MSLLGQAYFSKILVERLQPKYVKAVAICSRNDSILNEIANQHGIEIIVIAENGEKEAYY